MPLIGPGRRMMRRRAIVGAAAVGGAAYYAGKRGGERDAQEASVAEVEPQEAPATAEDEYVDELQQLAKLHEQGILTDEEFEAKKKDILGI